MLLATLTFPTAAPEDLLDYNFDFTAALSDVNDTIATVTASMRPSGSGEASISGISVSGAIVSLQIGGGVPGRSYLIKPVVAMTSGRIFIGQGLLPIEPTSGTYPAQQAPSEAFGTPVTWTGGATIFGANFPGFANGLQPVGTNQITALATTAQCSIFTIAGATNLAGARLPGGVGDPGPLFVANGMFRYINATGAAFPLYPPVGAQINDAGTLLAVNQPITLAPGSDMAFTTTSPSTLWYT